MAKTLKTTKPKDVEPLGLVPLDLVIVKDRYRVDKGDIDELADSLKSVGQITPITVNKQMKLLAGERRMLAARQLGWPTIRAEMKATDGEVDELEIELAENERRKSFVWTEVAKLEKKIFDLRHKDDPEWSLRKQAAERDTSKSLVAIRLNLAEAMELLPELAECETQADAWKQYKKLEEEAGLEYLRQSVPDQIRQAPRWASEHYRTGDALKGMAETPEASADFAEVDPPYGIDLVRRKDRNESTEHSDQYNEIDEDEFPVFFRTVAQEVHRILKPNSFAVFWYGHQWHAEIYAMLTEAGFAVNGTPAIWYKGQSGQTAQPDIMLASCYESFFLARKGKPRMRRQGRSNVFHYAPLPSGKKIHLTEKPVELLADILDTVLLPGSEVLVPFLGSGVTLRAAYKLGHTGFGWDLSEKHKEKFLRKVAEEQGDEVAEEELEETE